MTAVTIVTLFTLLFYMYTALRVGMARGTYKIDAPAISGHPIFERHYRVQMNTLEQLIIFIPALWIFSSLVEGIWAALIGGVFIVGRIIYAQTYVADPKKRSLGFLLGFFANVALVIGSLIAALVKL